MRLRRPSLPTAVAFTALFVALGGPAQAERFVTEKLRKGSVDSRVVKDQSIKMRDLRPSTRRALRRAPGGSITETKIAPGAVTDAKLAPGSVSSPAIRDRSVTAVDLAGSSVGGATVADGTLTGADVADGSLTGADVADRSLTGADVADGSLVAGDLGRFSGRFTMRVGPVPANACWTASQPNLAPERAGASIAEDLPVVAPDMRWPVDTLALTVQNSARYASRFAITACNVTAAEVPAFDVGFRYLVIRVP